VGGTAHHCEELAAERRLNAAAIEAIATQVHSARFGDGAEGLAAGQGITVLVLDLPACVAGLQVPDGAIVVRPRRSPASMALVVLHELAHHLLHALDHTHGDVWALTLALGAPRAVVARCSSAGELAATTGLPRWAASVRIRALAG
jgi:hypothetical protein